MIRFQATQYCTVQYSEYLVLFDQCFFLGHHIPGRKKKSTGVSRGHAMKRMSTSIGPSDILELLLRHYALNCVFSSLPTRIMEEEMDQGRCKYVVMVSSFNCLEILPKASGKTINHFVPRIQSK